MHGSRITRAMSSVVSTASIREQFDNILADFDLNDDGYLSESELKKMLVEYHSRAFIAGHTKVFEL